ncbi:MAG: UDP-N-acetylmuramoyl-tripeptide--D-alanyl-D-alanine ligase [Actinomycetota bacterium]
MRGFTDPFFGYSFILRTLLYVVIPAFGVWQFFRLKRAIHVFQLESYKRHWFARWCRVNKRRALFLGSPKDPKKPLAMTGRAWRMLVAGLVISIFGVLLPSVFAHLALGGAPMDIVTFLVMMSLIFFGTWRVLLLADIAMTPVQSAINDRFLRRAKTKLKEVSPLVIGVTGSYGKTSTKMVIAALLGAPQEVLATPGSFNTTLGVSRTINEKLKVGHRFFVVEMGARQEGDIAEIASMVAPTVGVLTAIGPAHLESFGSLESVRRAKSELIESLPRGGTAVVNVDDPIVREVVDNYTGPATLVRYGLDASTRCDVSARDLLIIEEGTALTLVDHRSGAALPVRTKLLGRHAVGHVLAGVAVALATGRELADLGPAVAALEPAPHRLQIIKGAGGVTVIDDAYNSNPSGAAAALEVLKQIPGGKKIVVTPGMVELGDAQDDANREFGRRAAEIADVLFIVARLNRRALSDGARSAGARCEVIEVDSLAEATRRFPEFVKAGDIVLFENDLPDQYEN